MTPAWAVRLLTTCGIIIAGPITSDALALARAIDIGSRDALLLFAQDHPSSPYAAQARRLAGNRFSPDASLARMASLKFDLPSALVEGRKASQVLKVYDSGESGESSSSGGTAGTGSRFGGTTPSSRNASPAAAAASRATASIEAKLSQFQQEAQECRGEAFAAARTCVADALENFARRLEVVPRTRGGVGPIAIPAIRKAVRGIRTAKTPRQARAAIAAAIPAIRKSIELIVAGNDDMLYRTEVRQRTLTVQALTIADQILVQATGL